MPLEKLRRRWRHLCLLSGVEEGAVSTYAIDSVFDHLYYSRGSKGVSAAEAERGTSSLLEEADCFAIFVVESDIIKNHEARVQSLQSYGFVDGLEVTRVKGALQ